MSFLNYKIKEIAFLSLFFLLYSCMAITSSDNYSQLNESGSKEENFYNINTSNILVYYNSSDTSNTDNSPNAEEPQTFTEQDNLEYQELIVEQDSIFVNEFGVPEYEENTDLGINEDFNNYLSIDVNDLSFYNIDDEDSTNDEVSSYTNNSGLDETEAYQKPPSPDRVSHIRNIDVSYRTSYVPWSTSIREINYISSESDNSDLWDVIRKDITWDTHTDNSRVKTILKQYRNNQEFFDKMTANAMPYLFYIVQILKEKNMPLELALLPVVESMYDPFALSFANAGGMWQFTSGTAKAMLIDRDWWFDGRRDVVISTAKALEYLEQLHYDLGKWELALSSYNAGPNRVKRDIRKALSAGRSSSFWNLSLPKETKYYYPRLLALVEVIKNPSLYGVHLPKIPNKPYFSILSYSPQISLKDLAEHIGISEAEAYKLNPGYNQWLTRPKSNRFLLVPTDQKIKAIEYLITQKNKDIVWERYFVESNISTNIIAKQFSTTAANLLEVNSYEYLSSLDDKVILVPIKYNQIDRYKAKLKTKLGQSAVKVNSKSTYHIVKSGESLWTISSKYNVSISSLKQWNFLSSDVIKPGQSLLLYQPKEVKNFPTNSEYTINVWRKITFPVRRKNSVYKIADHFGISPSHLTNWNSSLSNSIRKNNKYVKLELDVTAVLR